MDEQALLSCIAYVDLNPVRAAMATTPEDSDHTSVQTRVQHWQKQANNPMFTDNQPPDTENYQPENLHPFIGNLRQDTPKGILFNLVDYLQLLDWTGRQIREDKVGAIPSNSAPFLERLSISPYRYSSVML